MSLAFERLSTLAQEDMSRKDPYAVMGFLKNDLHFLQSPRPVTEGTLKSYDFISKDEKLIITTYSANKIGVFNIEAHDFETKKRLLIYKDVLGNIKTDSRIFGEKYRTECSLRPILCEKKPK